MTPNNNTTQEASSAPSGGGRWILIFGVVAVVAAIALLTMRPAPPPDMTRADIPMVQMVTTSGFCISQPDVEGDARIVVGGPSFDTPATLALHSADTMEQVCVGDLLPDTVHPYAIERKTGDDGWKVVNKGEVRTAPKTARPFRFIAFGDSGSGTAVQFDLAKPMLEQHADLIVHAGDFVYAKSGDSLSVAVLRPYADLVRSIPLFPSLGNHDVEYDKGVGYFNSMMLPENGPVGCTPEANYWFDYSGVRFVALDSNATFSEMHDRIVPWLDGVLASAGDRWIVAYFHHPIVTNGLYTPSGKVLNNFAPLFDKYHVNLVLCGHNHMYERSKPVRDGKVVGPGVGTQYITTGAGGSRMYDPAGPLPPELALQIPYVYSFTVFDVSQDKIVGKQIDTEGKVIDEFTVPRSPAVR